MAEGDGWGQPVHPIHRRFFNFIQKLADIGGNGFDVAEVPFGVQGAECQGRLSRSADADQGGDFFPGDIDIDAFQIVGGRPSDVNTFCLRVAHGFRMGPSLLAVATDHHGRFDVNATAQRLRPQEVKAVLYQRTVPVPILREGGSRDSRRLTISGIWFTMQKRRFNPCWE